jgi:DNA-binding response OmpR family regulator
MPATRLLIADNYGSGRECLATLLGQEGYIVYTMDCTSLHIDRFNAFDPELCLLALGRSDRSMIETFATIRVLSSYCPVIALASSTEATMAQAALQAGASAYLPKPLDFSQLLVTLHLCEQLFSARSEPPSPTNNANH